MGKETSLEPGKAVIGALITALIMKLVLFDFMIAEGHSMQPAINPGRILIVNKLNYGFRWPGTGTYPVRWAVPGEGDIVVFITPYGEIAVKRCIEIYSDGSFCAAGDNIAHSYDSRSYGPVPIDNIIGRVIGIK